MSKEKYLGRFIYNNELYESLRNGNFKELVDMVINDNSLNIHIRPGYLEIYYNGGLIAKINSEKSIVFNENYYYIYKKIPTTKAIKYEAVKGNLVAHRKSLIKKFKSFNFREYFIEAKLIMDKWFEVNNTPELYEQHFISLENQFGDLDYTVIDIEYKVSTESPFACTYIPKGSKVPKEPKFDILALDRNGVLCVMELKVGKGSLSGTSGLLEHYECFTNSVMLSPEPFIEEIKIMLKQKKELGIIDNSLEISEKNPEFMFIYCYDEKNSIVEQDYEFDKEYNKIGKNIKVIKLKQGSYKLVK